MSVLPTSDDATQEDRSPTGAARELADTWKTWAVAVGGVAIAVYAALNPGLTPFGYIPFFLALAVVAVLFGLQKLSFAPDVV
jgi:hypothetical protein